MNRVTRRLGLALLPLVLALAGGCGGGEDDELDAGRPATTEGGATSSTPRLVAPTAPGGPRITIQSFTFSGLDSIKAFTPITVENKDQTNHTISSTENRFAPMAVGPGETKAFPSLRPGTYPIRCDIHPSRMTGTLTVA